MPHPPIPTAGFHPPGDSAGDPYTIVHALYHDYAVVRYRAQLANQIRDELAPRVGHGAIIVGADNIPWAFGAIVYGRQLTCRTLGPAETHALATWLAHHRSPA
jgi:hypothetical protein